MFDLLAFVVPRENCEEEILLINMEENVKSLLGKESHVSFIDKLNEIKSIYSKKVDNDNYKNCLFVPFLMIQNLKYDESKNIVNEALNKLSKKQLSIKGYIFLTRRFIFYPHVNYKFIIYFTDPIHPKNLKISNFFWCNKDNPNTLYDINDHFIVGNEVEQILQLVNNDKYYGKDNKFLYEYKFNPYSNPMPFGFTKVLSLQHKIIVQSNCDEWVQNYVFADFMMNSYPSQVMSYPQFIGFAVARGFYMKRCLRLFRVFKSDDKCKLTFEEFLHGCIVMDLSSPHEGNLREARGNFIFKYYDYNKDNLLDFPELLCLVKRMRKKMGLANNMEETTIDTENIIKLLTKNSTSTTMRKCKISLKTFQGGLHLPELQGLTYLLRFSMKYLENTRSLMKKYVETVEKKFLLCEDLHSIGEDFSLIPYFIKEAYSSEELFESMILYSTNYSSIKNLLQKMNEKNKSIIVAYKVKTMFNTFITQIFYYLSELAFDLYHKEVSFPLRNPIFLIILFTSIAIVDPHMFNFSILFWRNIFNFFLFNSPAIILTLRQYQQNSISNLVSELRDNENLKYWTNKQNKQIKRKELQKENLGSTIFERFKNIYKESKNDKKQIRSITEKSSKLLNNEEKEFSKTSSQYVVNFDIKEKKSISKESKREIEKGKEETFKQNKDFIDDTLSKSEKKDIENRTIKLEEDLSEKCSNKVCKNKMFDWHKNSNSVINKCSYSSDNEEYLNEINKKRSKWVSSRYKGLAYYKRNSICPNKYMRRQKKP